MADLITPGPVVIIDSIIQGVYLTAPSVDPDLGNNIEVVIESSWVGALEGKWTSLHIDNSKVPVIYDGGTYTNQSCGQLRVNNSDLSILNYGNEAGTGRASDIELTGNRFDRLLGGAVTGLKLFGVAGGTVVGNKFRGYLGINHKAVRFEKDVALNTNDGIFCGGNSYDNCSVGVSVASGAIGPGTKIGPDGFDDTAIEYENVPPGGMSYAHTLLDGSFHTDTILDAATAGDIIYANATPKWQSLAISVPAANVRNVLGVDNGGTIPAWKTALDATLPATLVAGGAGAAGTSLVFSHRDHNHPAPATWPPGVHTHAHGDLTGVTADQHHAGFVGLIINGPSTISPDANDLITIEDTASVTWASSGAGKIAATAVAGGGGNMATDPLWDAAGDLAVGTGADTGARLVLTVPAATFFNVLGVFNAETTPTWKALFDATVPTTIAPSDAAATGSAVAAARRDHLHGAPATFPAMAHDLDGASHTGVADYTSVLGLTSLTIGDANFGLIISVGNPALTWDAGDFIQYVRASNYWSFAIGGVNMGHIGLDQFRLTLDGTVSSPDNAFAIYIGQIQLDPADGWAAFGLYGGGTVVATAGQTVSAAYGIYSEAMAKSGTGTITTAYGLYVVAPTIGTTNIGALIGGDVRETGYLRVGSASAPTNTTAGDLTCVRLFVGDAAAVAGKEALITGDMAITGTLVIGTAPDYTVTNGSVDRTFNADATTLDELADIVATLLADLTTMGLLQ